MFLCSTIGSNQASTIHKVVSSDWTLALNSLLSSSLSTLKLTLHSQANPQTLNSTADWILLTAYMDWGSRDGIRWVWYKDINGNVELREAVESHNPQSLEGIWPIERDGIRWMYYKDSNGNVELREGVESHNPQFQYQQFLVMPMNNDL